MPEYSIILAHNVLDGAQLISEEGCADGHEPERMRDGYRHTWWEARNLNAQFITITSRNLVENPDFEIDTSGWLMYTAGGAAGSISRNTVDPLYGSADLKADVTDADDSGKKIMIVATAPVFMRANRTYRLMGRFKGAQGDVIRIGFTSQDVVTEAIGQCKQVVLTGSGQTDEFDFTPTADGWYHPYTRIIQPGVYYYDEIICNEVRDVDTLIVDKGHTLRYALIGVEYGDNVSGLWTYAKMPGIWLTDAPVILTFPGVKALKWRIQINPGFAYWSTPPKIPVMYLGKRWTMPRYFSGEFDPEQETRVEDSVVGMRGIAQGVLKYNQRVLKATMNHLDAADFENVKYFFEDTENGFKPFFFVWKPTTDPTDILYMKLRSGRSVPFQSPTLRKWEIEAEEVVGARKV